MGKIEMEDIRLLAMKFTWTMASVAVLMEGSLPR